MQPSPFRQTYNYDAFDNMTSRSGTYSYQSSQTDTATYTNNKREGWTYDADGRVTLSPASSSSQARTWTYDAAGRLILTSETSSTGAVTTLTDSFDEDGRIVYESAATTATTFYLIRSSLLEGEVLTRLDSSSSKVYTYVPAEGLIFARQTKAFNGQPEMQWTHRDAVGLTEIGTDLTAYDPLGNFVPHTTPPGGQPLHRFRRMEHPTMGPLRPSTMPTTTPLVADGMALRLTATVSCRPTTIPAQLISPASRRPAEGEISPTSASSL